MDKDLIEKNIAEIEKKIKDNQELLGKEKDNKELRILILEDLETLKKQKNILKQNLEDLTLEKGPVSGETECQNIKLGSVIVEIRAGTGGDEASLFVGDLFRMYSKYAVIKNWKQKILDSSPTSLGGFKQIIFEVSGNNVYNLLKNEGGVHRVQRIPKTEKSGRVHTSTISVAILPKPKSSEIKINPQDLRIDTYKASGPGGQYVNKRMSAIRITHLPTNTVVTSQTERSLQQNKESALSILEARILEKKQIEESEKLSKERRSQIGWAKRAEKVRTYNFPQNRLTDHRIKKSWNNLDDIMEGKLNTLISALQKSAKQ